MEPIWQRQQKHHSDGLSEGFATFGDGRYATIGDGRYATIGDGRYATFGDGRYATFGLIADRFGRDCMSRPQALTAWLRQPGSGLAP